MPCVCTEWPYPIQPHSGDKWIATVLVSVFYYICGTAQRSTAQHIGTRLWNCNMVKSDLWMCAYWMWFSMDCWAIHRFFSYPIALTMIRSRSKWFLKIRKFVRVFAVYLEEENRNEFCRFSKGKFGGAISFRMKCWVLNLPN